MTAVLTFPVRTRRRPGGRPVHSVTGSRDGGAAGHDGVLLAAAKSVAAMTGVLLGVSWTELRGDR